MANPEHLALLIKGSEAWNKWRKSFPSTQPDLRQGNLGGYDLSGADLSEADLSGADLSGSSLRGANLASADLTGAFLRRTDLRQADLTGAHVEMADLTGARLTNEQLEQAHSSADTKLDSPDGAEGGAQQRVSKPNMIFTRERTKEERTQQVWIGLVIALAFILVAAGAYWAYSSMFSDSDTVIRILVIAAGIMTVLGLLRNALHAVVNALRNTPVNLEIGVYEIKHEAQDKGWSKIGLAKLNGSTLVFYDKVDKDKAVLAVPHLDGFGATEQIIEQVTHRLGTPVIVEDPAPEQVD